MALVEPQHRPDRPTDSRGKTNQERPPLDRVRKKKNSRVPLSFPKQNRIWIPDQRFYIAAFSLAEGLAKYNAEISSKEQGISVSCSPDERVRLALSAQGDISAFQATPPSVGFKTIATKPGASTILISPDAKTFVVWGPKLPILLYPVAGGKEQQTFKGHTAEVTAVVYCQDNKHLISVSLDRTMRIWNIESGKVVKQVMLPGAGAGLALSPDGRLAATSTFALGMIQVWQLPKEVISRSLIEESMRFARRARNSFVDAEEPSTNAPRTRRGLR